ncbi:MAG: aldehyde dehydrogenase family protein, partial [Pseudomonadota bacterium]|nr:aldehyde dehydrogenase family protein [Pseudomonadota bacterium]
MFLGESNPPVHDAIVSAKNAFAEWRNTPVSKRARVMFKFKSLLEEHADEIIALIG